MRYIFVCQDCKISQEVAMPMATASFKDRTCPYCGGVSKHKITGAPAISTQNMTHQTIDVTVGRHANALWDDIHRRQQDRDRVRVESQEVGLSMTGRNEFQPLTKEQKTLRTDLSSKVQAASYSESDAKLVGAKPLSK